MAATIPAPTVNDPARTKAHLPVWVAAVNEMIREYREARGYRPDALIIGKGRKYIRIWHGDGSSIFAFVRLADGAILKPATWKAPMLNHIRGSIFEPNVSKSVTPYGVRYMDDPALGRS